MRLFSVALRGRYCCPGEGRSRDRGSECGHTLAAALSPGEGTSVWLQKPGRAASGGLGNAWLHMQGPQHPPHPRPPEKVLRLPVHSRPFSFMPQLGMFLMHTGTQTGPETNGVVVSAGRGRKLLQAAEPQVLLSRGSGAQAGHDQAASTFGGCWSSSPHLQTTASLPSW